MFVPQSQAASQEVLEQKKANKEANLRFQLEQRIDELEGELRRARDSHRSTRTELERYQKLYTDELQLHKSLTDKLERSDHSGVQFSDLLWRYSPLESAVIISRCI